MKTRLTHEKLTLHTSHNPLTTSVAAWRTAAARLVGASLARRCRALLSARGTRATAFVGGRLRCVLGRGRGAAGPGRAAAVGLSKHRAQLEVIARRRPHVHAVDDHRRRPRGRPLLDAVPEVRRRVLRVVRPRLAVALAVRKVCWFGGVKSRGVGVLALFASQRRAPRRRRGAVHVHPFVPPTATSMMM